MLKLKGFYVKVNALLTVRVIIQFADLLQRYLVDFAIFWEDNLLIILKNKFIFSWNTGGIVHHYLWKFAQEDKIYLPYFPFYLDV